MRLLRTALVLAVTLGCLLGTRAVMAQDAAAAGVMTPEACRAQLEARHLAFSFTAPVAEGECGIPLPVRLQALAIGDRKISFSQAPVLDCRLAARLADWIGNVVEPLARHHLGSGLAAVETGPGYVCRKRNNQATGKISEHAKGNALDLAAFSLTDGRRIAVRPADPPAAGETDFLAAVRTTACGYFLTVLGPGSDAAHAEHLHVDLGPATRSPYYRICQ